MDKRTHIFGQSRLKPESVVKLVACTLEIARIRKEFLMNFPKAKAAITNIEATLIKLAQDEGVSPELYKETLAKVLISSRPNKPHLKSVGEENQAPSQDTSETVDSEKEL
jgi:hypothetical protein